MIKGIFTTTEIAEICRTSGQTVNRWLLNGELKGYRLSNTADWKVPRKELVQFMQNNGIPMDLLKDEEVIKILVIDDEKNMTSAIERAFRNEKHFQVEITNSGISAGLKIESFKPDVILLDIFVGRMDGREILKSIRQQPECEGIKIIGISGRINAEEAKALLDLGFAGFLNKPFGLKELKKLIDSLVAV